MKILLSSFLLFFQMFSFDAHFEEKPKADKNVFFDKLGKKKLIAKYIPKNLKECFIQLDKILSPKVKEQIKNLKSRKETIQFHHGLGTWIRNNWGLWGRSRLQKYFLLKKLNHPDEMSALILEFYYDWLNGKNEEWTRWSL